jgi:hypothetical protein
MKRHNATGRSVGAFRAPGRAKSWRIEEQFVHLPKSLIESPGYSRRSIQAARILDFLIREHLSHGGACNGELLAPYAQLAQAGISGRDISNAFRELEAFGIIRRTKEGPRLGGRRGAYQYALTWLPTADGVLPTNAFRAVTERDVAAYLAAKSAATHYRRSRRAKGSAEQTPAADELSPMEI